MRHRLRTMRGQGLKPYERRQVALGPCGSFQIESEPCSDEVTDSDCSLERGP